MDLQTYLEKRRALAKAAPNYRSVCGTCLQPNFSCYCPHIQSIDCKIKFAILIHPIEFKRRIATGRMSHLCLKNSELIVGQDYSSNMQVNQLIADPYFYPVVLYPGRGSKNLSEMSSFEKQAIVPPGKQLLVFVIDGTWATARRMMRRSQNLQSLPRLCFTPAQASQFRVRKQPRPECYSTLEAIHHSIELLGEAVGFEIARREHDKLLSVFQVMVEKQLEFVQQACEKQGARNYRRPAHRPASQRSSCVLRSDHHTTDQDVAQPSADFGEGHEAC